MGEGGCGGWRDGRRVKGGVKGGAHLGVGRSALQGEGVQGRPMYRTSTKPALP